MSKIGAHTTGAPRNGYGDFCKARPAVVTAVDDGGALGEVKRESDGHTVTIFRDTSVYLEAPGDINNPPGTYAEMASFWYPQLKAKWSQNPADYYTITNEQGGNDLRSIRNLVAYEREIMRLANADGTKVCILNLAGGSPGDFEIWKAEIAPFIIEAWAAGNIYGRHAYGGDLVDSVGNVLPGNPRRPIEELEWLNARGHHGGLVITEVGLDGGFGFAGIDRFSSQMQAYERAIRPLADLIGICSWNLGRWQAADANWQDAIPTMIAYMEANPTFRWEPPSLVEPAAIGRVVDVSRWQGAIDWDAFKSAGVDLAFLRASSGPGIPVTGSGADTQFHRNVSECDRLGILWGPYHYLYPGGIDDQALLFAQQVALHQGTVSLPPVLDVELNSLAAGEVKAFIDAWNGHIPGRPLMIYTGNHIWNNLGNPAWSTDHHLWIAHWTSSTDYIEPLPGTGPTVPAPWTDWVFWQWTSHGGIPGHDGSIDLDFFNGDRTQLLEFIATGQVAPPAELPHMPTLRIDLTPYFTGDLVGNSRLFEAKTMQNGNDLGQQRHQLQVEPADAAGNTLFYFVKGGDGPNFPSQWEELRVSPIEGTIQRGKDTSHGPDTLYELYDIPGQRWSNWCPVKMAVGESYRRLVGELVISTKVGCNLVDRHVNVGSWIKLVAVHPVWASPHSGIVLNDVIQMRWSHAKDGPLIEDYYFSADAQAPGLVGWDSGDGRRARPAELHAPGARPNSTREQIDCP